MIDSVVTTLRNRAGAFHCELSEIDWVGFDEIENELIAQFPNNSDDFFRVSAKAFELLRLDDDVEVREFDGTAIFVSRLFDRPWKCTVRLFLYQHIQFLILGTVILGGIGSFLVWKSGRRQIAIECQRYADIVITHLKLELRGAPQTSEQLKYWLTQQLGGQASKYWARIEALVTIAPFVEVRPAGEGQIFRFVFRGDR
jgi:hypothetical protein